MSANKYDVEVLEVEPKHGIQILINEKHLEHVLKEASVKKESPRMKDED